MSQENVEIMRRAYGAYNRRDFEALLALWDPEIEWERTPDVVEARIMRGRDEVRRFMEDWLKTFADLHIEVEELLDRENQVLAVIRLQGRTRHGVDSDARYAQLITFREGRAIRVKDYNDRAEALEAAGLEE